MIRILVKVFRFLLPIAIIGGSVIGFVALRVDAPDAKVEPPQQRVWPVHVLEVQKEPISPTVQLFGSVVIPGQSELSSILDAEVINVFVRTGDSVERGNLLVQLDTRNIDTQIKQLEADSARVNASIQRETQKLQTDRELLKYEKQLLVLATESRSRVANLRQDNLSSQAQLDDTVRAEQQAQLSVALREASIREYDSRVASLTAERERVQASLDKARLDIEDSVLTAPFAGRITNVHVAPGNRVRNGTRILDLYDPSQIEIRALIPNRYLSNLRDVDDQGLSVKAETFVDNQRLVVEFDRFSSSVTAGRGGVDAYFRLISNNTVPELGRTLDLSVSLPVVDDAIAIPYQAVYGSNQVFKVEDNKMKSVTIQRYGQVERNETQFIVASSAELQPKDQLIVTQLTNAVDGLSVEPWQAD